MDIELRVVEIQIRDNNAEESFCFVQTIFQGFDVLWCGVAAAIGGLIVGAF